MTDMDIKYVKTRIVKSPKRVSKHDAGIDLFIPQLHDELCHKIMAMSNKVWPKMSPSNDKIEALSVHPGGRILIPSGLHFKIPDGTALVAFNKNDVATKLGFTTGACVCDSRYQGELHISLINSSTSEITIHSHQKIQQFLLLPVYHSPIEEVDTLTELYSSDGGDK
tara:strand:+ start:3294 stop:3794 length:501 start_codon:yes stop_codon:yes gene_type:complete